MVEPKLRLMNFVPESQEQEIPDSGGVKTGDGFDNRPLFEILKENKDRKDAEFHERFKHRPPKALDDDETEFLEKVEMVQREQERLRVEEEKLLLINFQAEILSRSIPAEEPKTINAQHQERLDAPSKIRRSPLVRVLPAVKIKPVPKRRKTENSTSEATPAEKPENDDHSNTHEPRPAADDASPVGLLGLASYGGDSEEED